MIGGEPGDPIDWYDFKGTELVFDTIYSPLETDMLARARKAGCRTMNGLSMLKWQAIAQFELFTGQQFPDIDIYSFF
jgi:shikimate 5-dehydrogenase